MPIGNKLLRSLSSIDPDVRGLHQALKLMRNIPSLVTNVLSNDDLTMYDLEIRKFHIDSSIKNLEKGTRIDTWWTGIFETGIYPTLTKGVF